MATENSTQAACNPDTALDSEAIAAIRHALLIGLESYGEVERLISECEIAEMVGRPQSENLRPIHPTGTSTTVSDFAAALRYLEGAESASQAPKGE